ncbi:MAG: T9SS type A sorting domain-containing protein, partial [Candidatus Edwardsbacteria bacterium]|nr:T9SS type A sorting domain-containing protein [Candidatus Edwardsbacteria bacterium]
FLNGGAAITAGAQCSLYALSGTQYVTILNPGWQTVGGGSIATNTQGQSGPFVVSVSQGTPRFTDILFGVTFRSATPSYTDTSNFTLRISPFNIERTYDFSQLYVGGSDYRYRLKPSDLAVWHDTLYVANANLDVATVQNRIHKVRRNASSPVVGADTARSINNMGTVNSTGRYLGGIDADSSGNLWYSIADSIYSINRVAPSPTINSRFKSPNVAWAPTGSAMKRVRGVGMGPSVVDTVGPDPLPGDSLWAYWQQYNTDGTGASVAGATLQESLYVIQRGPANGTSTVRYRFGLADSAWGAQNNGAGYSWWNGRAMEYDGSNLWTSSVWQNLLIRRDARNGHITMMLPGPSMFGSYGTYGIAHEATDAAGTPYAPSGTVSYRPYQRGTRHYLYCASMDEGKIYKILATDFFVPTPCANPPDPATDSIGYKTSSRSGSAVAAVDSFMDTGAKTKAMHYYTVVPLNYGGSAGYGASVTGDPFGVSGGPVAAPGTSALGNCAPNPAGAGTATIAFALAAPGKATLKLYNILGEEVRTLVDRNLPAGHHSARWDCRDGNGEQVASGVYFYTLSAGNFNSTRKLMVLR